MIEDAVSGHVDSGAWLAAFGPGRAAPRERAGRGLAVLSGSPLLSERDGCSIIFDGVLHDRAELQERLADDLPPGSTDAELVAQAYRRWGEAAMARLKGIFALIIVDSARDLLLCARDPLGIRPLFYAEVGPALLLSPSVEALLRHPGVSTALNRACLVDRLTRRWLAGDETYFAHVRRSPPGHIMRVSGQDRRVWRYWDPAPADGRIDWIPDDEAQERFEAALAQAVARCLAPGQTGVYTSGGLDSSMLAMVGTDLARDRGWAPPCALSLAFSEIDPGEGATQRGLATALGLPQVRLPFEEAAGPEGTLGAALAMTRDLPAPLAVMWRPALRNLALQARERGCGVILAGDGADEWLSESPVIAADLLRSLDLAGLHRLWRVYARSYHFSRREAFRLVIWRYAVMHLAPDAYEAAAIRLGARRLVQRRRHAEAMIAAASPPWIAPDPSLRAQVAARFEACHAGDRIGTRGYYLRDVRARLDSADKWFREEETFLVGQRAGLPIREPFWDPDLIELLVRVRPRARSADGLAKSLVRRPLTARFPDLGFEGQRKSNLGASLLSVLETQASTALQAMGGLRTLVDLGVIEGTQVRSLLDDALAGRSHRHRLGWAWEILNLEAWARAHC